MTHHASPEFWDCYRSLPASVQTLADRAYQQLKADPQHPSLHLKQVDSFWSVRVGLHYRALGVTVEDGILWFWLGTHAEYDRMTR